MMNPSSNAKYLIDELLKARHECLKALRTSTPDLSKLERLESRCIELSDELSSVVDAAGATGWGIGDDVAEAMMRLEAAVTRLSEEEKRAAGWRVWESHQQAAVAGGLNTDVMLADVARRIPGLAIVTGDAVADHGSASPQREQTQGAGRRTIAEQIGAKCWAKIKMTVIMDQHIEAESRENPFGIMKVRIRCGKLYRDLKPEELMPLDKIKAWETLSALAVNKGGLEHKGNRHLVDPLNESLTGSIGLAGKCFENEAKRIKCGFTISHQMIDMCDLGHSQYNEERDYDDENESVYG